MDTKDWILIGIAIFLAVFFIIFAVLWFTYKPFKHWLLDVITPKKKDTKLNNSDFATKYEMDRSKLVAPSSDVYKEYQDMTGYREVDYI